MPSMIEILVIPSAHALFEYKISHVFNKKYEYLQDDARYQLVFMYFNLIHKIMIITWFSLTQYYIKSFDFM